MSGQNPVGAMQLGPCLVDSESCSVERDGERSKVTPRSMDVLLYLAEHADRIVSSDELLDTFWSPLASDHAVHKAIAELRSALGDSVRAQRFIKTIPKRGYKLLVVPAAVEEEKPESRPMPGLPDRILQWLRYLDPRVLVTGLLVVLSIGALSLFHPHLALAPAGRSS